MGNRSKDQTLFFVGAGISIESGFPAALSFIDQVLQRIAPDETCLAELRAIMPAPNRKQRAHGDYLRFELLLEILQNLADTRLDLLSFIPEVKTPNSVHYLLAARAIAGDVIVTTNFDSLIELAILELGALPVSVCRNETFPAWKAKNRSNYVPVFKLHGSFIEHEGENTRQSLDTIQATLTALTRGTPVLSLSNEKRSFLASCLSRMRAVVAGYSGSDDLDIMPAFLTSDVRFMLWIEHESAQNSSATTREEVRKPDPEIGAAVFSPKERLLAQLSRSGRIEVERGITASILFRRFGNAYLPIDKTRPPFKKLAEHLDKWAEQCLAGIPLRRAIAADIFYRLSYFNAAAQQLDSAWSEVTPDDPLARLIARIRSKTDVRFGYPASAFEWAERAVNLLPPDASAEERIRCRHQLGFSAYRLSDLDHAKTEYDTCLEIAMAEGLDYWVGILLHDSALLRQDRGQHDKAMELYRSSIEASSRAGDISHVGWSLFQLGTCEYDRGNFENARKFFEESDRLAQIIGDVNHLSYTQHELGMIDFIAGNLFSAAKRFRKCLQIDRSTGQSEFTAETDLQFGVLLLEANKQRRAKRRFEQALAAFERRGDHEYRSEALSFLAQCDLLAGQKQAALRRAQAAANAAERSGVPASMARAEWMLGWVLCRRADPTGPPLLGSAIERAKAAGLRTLLLDLVYLMSREGLEPVSGLELENLRLECIEIYQQIGNRARLEVLLKPNDTQCSEQVFSEEP